MPIYTIMPTYFGSFSISNHSSGYGDQPVSGLTSNTLNGIRLQADSENGDRIIFDSAGTYQVSLSTLAHMSIASPTGTYGIRGSVRKNTFSQDYALNHYTYYDDGSHPVQSRCAVEHINVIANDYIRMFTFDATNYPVVFDMMRVCVTKIS